ncbi:MAG: anthranilate phosphoribosyltransferase [Sulfurovum sp.]|nr:MAG: anthranilate phosphoribosyltransferase [Sulfurovum sp.]
MSTNDRFEKLFNNELSGEEAEAFLIELYNKPEDENDIAICANIMRSHSIKLPMPVELQDKIIDIVGTGGDKSGSYNISSASSLILASLGCFVAKHGNRGVTSKAGSADVLETLGINLNLTPASQIKMLQEVGFCFSFAQNHHPSMKHIMPIRKSIPHRTIFNLLGPLTSPAGAKKYLLGLFSKDYIEKVALALVELDTISAYVVSSEDGMDEISLSANTHFAYVGDKNISYGEINPELYGFKKVPSHLVAGGDADTNANIIRDIFNKKEMGAKRDILVLNASFALFTEGSARDLQEAIYMVESTIDSGKASRHLEKIISLSQKL